MRSTTLRGLDDELRYDFGGDVGLIYAVMEIGVGAGALICKAKFKGVDLVKFLKKHAPRCEIIEKINPEYDYELTSYDW